MIKLATQYALTERRNLIMTEEEKMLAGKLYDPSDPKLDTRRLLAHRLSMEYNNTLETDAEKRKAILAQLLPNCGEDTFLQGPLQFDYGCYTRFGKRCYANFNLVVLDVCPVTFGDDVFIGPNCSFVSPMHALLPEERNLKQRPDGSYYDLEYGKPITVGSNCWFGSNVTVCGGVTDADVDGKQVMELVKNQKGRVQDCAVVLLGVCEECCRRQDAEVAAAKQA